MKKLSWSRIQSLNTKAKIPVASSRKKMRPRNTENWGGGHTDSWRQRCRALGGEHVAELPPPCTTTPRQPRESPPSLLLVFFMMANDIAVLTYPFVLLSQVITLVSLRNHPPHTHSAPQAQPEPSPPPFPFLIEDWACAGSPPIRALPLPGPQGLIQK